MSHIKKAETVHPVLDIIKNRWSPRSFSEKPISKEDMNTMLEAASWSFSGRNEQPWRYMVAHKDTDIFHLFFELLFPGNRPWNKKSAALILSLGKETYGNTEEINKSMLYDVGASNMLLTLQANSMEICSHIMEGFDKEKAKTLLNLDKHIIPVVMISLGYLDHADKLEEPFKTRETSKRSRKKLGEFVLTPIIY
jgi:nitroreductase